MLPDVVSQTHSTHRIFIEYCIVFKLNSIRGSISVPTQALTIYRERVLARYEHTSRSLFSHTIRIFAYKSYVNKPLPLSRSHSVFGRLLYTCQHCWTGWLCWCFFFRNSRMNRHQYIHLKYTTVVNCNLDQLWIMRIYLEYMLLLATVVVAYFICYIIAIALAPWCCQCWLLGIFMHPTREYYMKWKPKNLGK